MRTIVLSIIFLVFLYVNAHAQSQNDSTSIVQILEKESTTWRNGDMKAHADCWKIQPYSRILVSTADGKMIDVPPSLMINPPAGMMGNGGTFAISDNKISIIGNSAWVNFSEESISKEGQKSHSYEIKILEKINGSWKIVGQSIHLYNK
ncbi:MAG TPA: hypothetical protein VGG71_15675 [Chitinophagaceae bacterium]